MTEPPADAHALIDAARARLRAARPELQALSLAARAGAIETAAQALLRALCNGGERLDALANESGLSAQNVAFGLRTTLELFRAETLLELARSAGAERTPAAADPRPMLAVLAGNVFTASARPLLLPLLCGVPVLAKLAQGAQAFPRALREELHAVEPALGRSCELLELDRHQAARAPALLTGLRCAAVYGDDDTLAALAARLPGDTPLLRHGHGFGLAYVDAQTLREPEQRTRAAQALALDLCAYDQRGCLSPQAVLLESEHDAPGEAFAADLAEALRAREPSLPRGRLSAEEAAAQAQWRGVAAACGQLHQGESFAVGYEGGTALRPSPGHRNVSLHRCAGPQALAETCQRLGAHLKALGLAAPARVPGAEQLAPYVCELGRMQTPPLEASLDRLHPLAGLI